MSFTAPRGVVAPILTPFNDDLSIATDLYVELARRLFDEGCAGLAPFGTTGEALSVGIDERIEAIDALINGGVDPALMIPGTGLSNVADTARLSRACLDRGCAAVMTLPPFYYKAVSEDGLYRYFECLLKNIGNDARVYLYHIPPIAIVGIPPSLAARLRAAFGDPLDLDLALLGLGADAHTASLFPGTGAVRAAGITTVVRPCIRRSMASCTSCSASVSRALVASSKIRMRGLVTSARAMAIRWRWPPERLAPCSPTRVS